MNVTRYDTYDNGDVRENDEGEYVLYDDAQDAYAALNEKLQATWAEHFLLSRENATLLKERIRLSKELAALKALLEPRVWQD